MMKSMSKIDVDALTAPINIYPDVTTEKLLGLRAKRLSYGEIAKIVGLSKQAVWMRIHNACDNDEDVEEYKSNRADYLAGLQWRILKSIDNADIKKTPFNLRVISAGILYDKERLERGQSTAIIDAGELTRDIEQIRAERDVLIQAIQLKKASITP